MNVISNVTIIRVMHLIEYLLKFSNMIKSNRIFALKYIRVNFCSGQKSLKVINIFSHQTSGREIHHFQHHQRHQISTAKSEFSQFKHLEMCTKMCTT